MPRGRPANTNQKPAETYLDKISNEVSSNQSKISMILGALIILVVGILVFNYLSKGRESLGPAQQIKQEEGDVSPEKLPGKYTVKEGDSLFQIAEKYYKDGYKYPEIAKENKLDNPDALEVGQVLEIPKLEPPSPTPMVEGQDTQWGPAITGGSYTVIEGDWLSKIAGRSYGDIMAYDKIAKANNIQNPDLIEPGMTLTIPR